MPQNKRLWLAVVATFMTNGMLYGIWASRIPAIADRFDLAHDQLGFLLLLLAGGGIVSFPIAGRIADHFGACVSARTLLLVNGITLTLLAWAPNIWLLSIALFTFGVTQGGLDVAMNAWASEVERKVGKPWMPSFHAMWSLAAALGAFSGYVAISLGLTYSLHFTLAAVALPILGWLGMQVPWVSAPPRPSNGALFPLPKGALLFAGLLSFCATFGEGTMADWSAIYLLEVTLSEEKFAPIGFALFSASMVIMRLLGGMIIQKLGVAKATMFSGITGFIGVSLAVFVATPTFTLIGFTLMGFGFALAFPLAITRAANDPDIPQAQAIASVATLGYGGLLLAPPIIGFIASASSLRMAFTVMLLLSILMIAISRSFRHETKTAGPLSDPLG
ncbi:MFS transporter [Cognatishimia sp. WU-CL00825]|uniref:MFS transporter n=1 Tax=Cognatishimia sp. WU-CL00825 TaxID=3127658 RepID=UPI00310AB3F5